MYRIANAPVLSYPFPHMVVAEILPPGFHRHALAMRPPTTPPRAWPAAGAGSSSPSPACNSSRSTPRAPSGPTCSPR